MPPNHPSAPKPYKPYFFYGHRKPSQNRPVVYGGLFSSRKTIPARQTLKPINPPAPFHLHEWDPDHHSPLQSPSVAPEPPSSLAASRHLSPIARFIVDAFRRNRGNWGPPIVAELGKLRRVTPGLVAEVLKVENNPTVASKFFAWAGRQKGYRHNYAAYNALAYCLNRNNKFRAADQLPELMDSQGKPPTEKQFEILIRMHADANRGLRLYYVYEKMKKFGVKPRVFLYNKIVDGLVRTDHLDLALSVYDDFRNDGLVEDSVTYMILIKGLCKEGRINEMMEILAKMRANLCKPDVFAYTAIVKILVSKGNLDGCLGVWEEMTRDGVEADVMAYGTLVTGLCKGKRMDKAFELFQEMKAKGILIDRAIYGILVESFVASGKVESAYGLLKDLIDSGYRADLRIYNSLIEGLCSVKDVDKAHKLFFITLQEDLQPDFGTVNPILVSYAKMRRMEDFSKLLMQMEKFGFSVINDLSSFFSSLVCEADRIPIALDVFRDLKVKGYCSVSIYNILMAALKMSGDVKLVMSLFDEMKNSQIEPDSLSYSTAIECLVAVGDIKEACTCYNKIMELSCLPSKGAYCSLAKGLSKIGEIDATMMLIRDCLASVTSGPMEFKYCLTILHVSKSGQAEKVVEVLDEMVQEGFPPSDVAYSAVISGFCKHGTIEEARKVFSSMQERKLLKESDAIIYDDMLVEHMQKKTADLVLSGLKFFGLERKLKAKGCNLLPLR
ncbi:uncharacterized protein J3R85_003933 [Psidium guajava]|nr:uncharacterized protein J3R85_003933 [Psidium guajava]